MYKTRKSPAATPQDANKGSIDCLGTEEYLGYLLLSSNPASQVQTSSTELFPALEHLQVVRHCTGFQYKRSSAKGALEDVNVHGTE